MREHFNSVPAGPVQLTRSWLDRVQRSARRGTGVDLASVAGAGDDNDLLGTAFLPDPEVWLFARITATPDDSAASSSYYPGIACDGQGYSWVELRPARCGTWANRTTGEGLSGDNGTADDKPVRMPAFPLAAGATFAVGDRVLLVRGFQHGGTEQKNPGQEWVIVGTAPATRGGMANVRIVSGVVGNAGTGGAEATDPVTMAYMWLGFVQEWLLIDGAAPPDDVNQPVWFTTEYQTNIWGSTPDIKLDTGRAYRGKYTGQSATCSINLKDGPVDGDGNGTTAFGDGTDHVVSLTLPIVWAPLRPVVVVCEDGAPVVSGWGDG